VNAGRRQFRVQLVEPRRGGSYAGSVLARARVDAPADRSVDRVEFFVNERKVATLYQPPWAQPVALSREEELAYVRAVAYLPDGTSVEDVVFVNAPGIVEQLDVQVVELYTSVLDRAGRPVLGLGRDAFAIFEDRERQEILKFEAVGNQPIHVGILFDNSASMAPLLDAARVAALRFFREAIGPRDRAAVITFNRVAHLAQGLTNDLRLLGGGLAGLSAEGETALYDSVMFGLYYFAGVRGQRALLLLSDGKDEVSRFTFEKTLDYARRAGVALYAVGLGLRDPATRGRLESLAVETGGRAFFIDDLARLGDIYVSIQEELRSQYLLTYQSSNTGQEDEFRTIEVRLDDRDLTARTLSGYYP
jgi:Ca-activated chloride channel family protein